MFRYFVMRLLGLVPTMFLVTVCVFFFVHLLPGDPAQLAAGPEADEETVQMVRERLGLDRPLPEQFVLFVKKTVTGDFGISIRSQRPVIDEVADRFGPTLLLTVAAMVWAVAFGLLIGVVSAVKRGRWPDRLGMAFAVSGISMPPFALGILLMEVFSVWLGWFPTVGAESWRHYVLPSITLGAGVAAVMARFTRSALIEVLSEDYVRTARAKGLPARQVLSRHALRNALIPVVTMMGLQFGFLLGGSIVVEKVFNWPGMGRLLVDAVEMRDYPVMQTCVLLFSMEFLLINLAVDLLYGWLNPSIRYGNKGGRDHDGKRQGRSENDRNFRTDRTSPGRRRDDAGFHPHPHALDGRLRAVSPQSRRDGVRRVGGGALFACGLRALHHALRSRKPFRLRPPE